MEGHIQHTTLDPTLFIICVTLFILIVYIGVKKGMAKGASRAINR